MGKEQAAAIYARSSKDRADISPAAQSRALEQLAASRSLAIVETFEDVVETGSTDDRPGFQALIRAVKDPARAWSNLLVYDTSRIARRRHIAQAFKHELKKRGITLLYATIPELDPITDVLVTSIFEAMDEVHSLMSREKGLAGMAENVRQGWRAGGRAPLGYQLRQHATGAIRDGKPVTKSRLEPSEHAHQVKAYLRGRVRGVPRPTASKMAGIDATDSSLIGMEWNALTYAGHTVWNVNREAGSGAKRRPRAEWHIRRDTHPALITEREAESLLAQLETSSMADSLRRSRAEASRFLLSGLIYTTDGRAWRGHGPHYRLRNEKSYSGRLVRASELDEAVINKLQEFRTSDAYVAWLLEQSRRQAPADSPLDEIRGQVRKLERERQRAAEAAIASEAAAVYHQVVEQRTRQIEALRRELVAVEREAAAGAGVSQLGIDELRTILESQDPTRVVKTLIERVVLEPDLHCQIQLRRNTSPNALWRGLASPGGSEPQPQDLLLSVELVKRA